MDQIVQLLFNPNHQAPSPLVLAVLVALAVGMPAHHALPGREKQQR